MKKFLRNAIFSASIFIGCCSAHAAWGDSTISAMAGPSPITIRTCSYDAGAVCSLTWNGKEFINDYDHGRQLQSAAFYNITPQVGINPTEAGSAIPYNGANPSPSSSVLQGIYTVGNALATQTNMAFWVPIPGQSNTAPTNHILNKHITIGAHGLPHVIEYLTHFTLPAGEFYMSGTFETVTAYMPYEFNQFWTIDLRNGANSASPLAPTNPVNPNIPLELQELHEQTLPIIFSTVDAGWALGIYSPDSPQADWPGLGYGRWDFPGDTVKLNNGIRLNNISGDYGFRTYVIVGTLQDVISSMKQLYNIVH